MNDIFDSEGNVIAAISLSERNRELLDRGVTVTIMYHTPQLMRSVLGDQSGQFALFKHEDQIRTTDPMQVKAYADLQANIVAQRVA